MKHNVEGNIPYPFVEDKGLILARKLKLQIAADQIQRAIFAVTEKREIVSMQLGETAAITTIKNCRNIGIVNLNWFYNFKE